MMKKMIAILTVLLLCMQIVSPVFAEGTEPIENEFTDIHFLTAVREIIGKTNGEPIYQSDVETITALDIHDKEIKDLHGLEYFTGLKSFICYFNEFSEMDLSHNTKLEYIDFSYNVDIKTVDFSHNLALETVECNYTTVESLNLTNNINLKMLVCYGTEISELNLENNTRLEELDAYDMKLKRLDVSKNVNLKFLDCSWNQLTELNVSNQQSLEFLGCDHNYMDSDPKKSIIGYEAVAMQLGEPKTFDDCQETGFAYYPQETPTYPYEITDLRLTDTSGAEIEKPQENKGFIVQADIVKTGGREEKDYLFVAVYDKNGTPMNLDYVKANFAAGGACSFGFYIPAQEKPVGRVTAFVWNTFHAMEPLAKNKTLVLDEN